MGTHTSRSQVINVLALRKLIGALAFLLPVVLVAGSWILGECTGVQSSISNYYHTVMRNYFVGTLCAVGVFLFAYKGYERKDDIAGDIAAFLVLLVAFLPTSPQSPLPICNIPPASDIPLVGTLHLAAAAGFFLVLSYFSLFLFIKGEENPTPEKLNRNRVYRTCGYLMLGCIGCLFLVFVIPSLKELLEPWKPVFWLETVALFAFGFSWLVKGEVILKDH